MSVPRPIPTRYRGIRYRSRLEARYAVFFENLQIQYWYEPEGFTLRTGIRYLPDFYLPQFDLFAEVKPLIPNGKEQLKAEMLSETGISVVLLIGPPDFRVYPAIIADGEEHLSLHVLLDVADKRKLFTEGRLFMADPKDHRCEDDFSASYRNAVWAALDERFEEAA